MSDNGSSQGNAQEDGTLTGTANRQAVGTHEPRAGEMNVPCRVPRLVVSFGCEADTSQAARTRAALVRGPPTS